MEVVVRKARREELERVNELRKAVNDLHVQGRPAHFKPGFGPELQGCIYDQFESDRFDILVALVGGEVAGFVTLQYIHRPEGPYTLPLDFCRVEEFGVDAGFRRRGVGTALVDHMKKEAAAHGLSRIDLDVWAFNDSAKAFYDAAGFTAYRTYMELEV